MSKLPSIPGRPESHSSLGQGLMSFPMKIGGVLSDQLYATCTDLCNPVDCNSLTKLVGASLTCKHSTVPLFIFSLTMCMFWLFFYHPNRIWRFLVLFDMITLLQTFLSNQDLTTWIYYIPITKTGHSVFGLSHFPTLITPTVTWQDDTLQGCRIKTCQINVSVLYYIMTTFFFKVPDAYSPDHIQSNWAPLPPPPPLRCAVSLSGLLFKSWVDQT